ncbi:phage major capsid protein, P2 family [Salinisphaera sp. USBA-960]|nr:phage major capsid protein, P2 family [Salifodinibacter halophilus]NNC25315.1 phage major capsid protein, P2 family [Salifodinibacter halophilus]
MRNDTRTAFNRYLHQIARLSDVTNAADQFSVTPSVQQTLEQKIQESSALLQMVNVMGVDELKGQKLMLSSTGPIAGRTDVTANDRTPRDMTSMDGSEYEARPTEFDTFIPWAKLDAWAKFPNFQTMIRDAIVRQQALDRIMIGLNGTSAATETDRVSSPLLEDVNIGWLQQYRSNRPDNVMTGGATAGTITVGDSDADYANLDALVFDAAHNLIDPWFRESPDLVVMCSRTLLDDKYFQLIDSTNQPTERNALDIIMSTKRLGGYPAMGVPYFPANSIMITSMENLSLYYQLGSRRRRVVDEPKRSRIENYESSNDAYVVEDYGFGCLIENIDASGSSSSA